MQLISLLGRWGSYKASRFRKPIPKRPTLEALDGRSVPSFLTPLSSPGGGDSLAVGDFNQDGRDDVVVISGTSSMNVSLSKGDGTFNRPISLGGAKGPLLFGEALDANGDGQLDVVGIGYSRKHSTVCNVSMGWCSATGTRYDNVWLGNGDGTFGPVQTTSTHVTVPGGWYGDGVWPSIVYNSTATAPDFNHDGHNDLAELDTDTNTISVSLGNADGSYQPAQIYAAGQSPRSIAAGDFNGDGWIDVVVVNGNKLSVWLNDGSW